MPGRSLTPQSSPCSAILGLEFGAEQICLCSGTGSFKGSGSPYCKLAKRALLIGLANNVDIDKQQH
jgi:hypothetical protein